MRHIYFLDLTIFLSHLVIGFTAQDSAPSNTLSLQSTITIWDFQTDGIN